MSGKKGMKQYPTTFKIQVVEDYLSSGSTRNVIAEKYGIKMGRVEVWTRIYRAEGLTGLQKPKGRPRKRTYTKEEKLRNLEIENELLKKALSELRNIMPVKRNIGPLKDIETNTRSK
jgi:transposase